MSGLTETFSIADVISEDLITLELKTTNKNDAITELSILLFNQGFISDVKDFTAAVFARENEGMTGLGQGIAIPHGKSDSVIKTSLAVGRTATPIEWESLDEKPVNVVILFAVKNTEANTVHIKLLQKVAVLLAEEDFIQKLHEAKSKEEMLELLSKDPNEE